jgi:hypothetical protein
LQEVKSDPNVETDDTLVEKYPQVKQSKRHKGKKIVTYPNKPKTRPKNKLRLNSKPIFKLSLNKDNLIILDEEVTNEIPKKSGKGKKQLLEPDLGYSHSEDKMEPNPPYVLEMHELLEVDT